MLHHSPAQDVAKTTSKNNNKIPHFDAKPKYPSVHPSTQVPKYPSTKNPSTQVPSPTTKKPYVVTGDSIFEKPPERWGQICHFCCCCCCCSWWCCFFAVDVAFVRVGMRAHASLFCFRRRLVLMNCKNPPRRPFQTFQPLLWSSRNIGMEHQRAKRSVLLFSNGPYLAPLYCVGLYGHGHYSDVDLKGLL